MGGNSTNYYNLRIKQSPQTVLNAKANLLPSSPVITQKEQLDIKVQIIRLKKTSCSVSSQAALFRELQSQDRNQ